MNHRYKIYAPVALAVGVYILFRLFDLDLWERFGSYLALMERYELDELLLVGVALGMFEYRRYSHWRRGTIYQATAGAAQHVLGNFLQGLQAVKTMARESGNVPPEVFALCDRLATDANFQLKALSSIQKVNEKLVWRAVASANPPAPQPAAPGDA